MRRLLGYGKWYQLRLRSRWHYQFSNERHNFHKGIWIFDGVYYSETHVILPYDNLVQGIIIFLKSICDTTIKKT